MVRFQTSARKDIKKALKKLLANFGLQIAGSNRLGINVWHNIKRLDIEPSLVFDVGANIGQWATECRAALPHAKIYSFEPEPKAFNSLNAAFIGDPLHTAFQVALSSNDGRANLTISPYPTMHSLEETFANKSHERIEVICNKLDNVLRDIPEKRISLLKIDVEGHELHCLDGAKLALAEGKIDLILIEAGFLGGCHTPLAYIESILKPHRFNFLALYDLVSKYQRAEIDYCNALFVREGIALR